jgi:Domain of unknown function (DUF6851)/VCPO second helical-bundle domain
MARRFTTALLLVTSLVTSLVLVTTQAAKADVALPLPALPIGPGPLFPVDTYGPTASDDVVLKWNEQALAAIRTLKPPPTVSARALAITHTSMYDAWAAYDTTAVGTRLGGSLRRPADERTLARKSEAISYAAYRSLRNLFPIRDADFTSFLRALGYDPDDTSTDPSTPAGVGNLAAQAVLAFRADDGANQAGGYADTSGYTPVNTPDAVNDPFHWQPLRVPDGHGGSTIQKFTTPQWGTVTPFASTSGSMFEPSGPTRMTLGLLDQEVTDILVQSATLTDVQKVRAEYWADGPATETPPGHWCSLAQAVARARGYDLDADTRLFFALGNALLDASIAAWHAKRQWDYVRPITAIRTRKAGQLILAWGGPYKGTRLIRGEDWVPYQVPTFLTPSFPEYVSGHSTFSAAAARVLRSFTGADTFGARVTIRRGSSRIEPGLTPLTPQVLTWPTFSAALDEAGRSRRQGGIHFLDGDYHGRALGDSVGANAWAKAQSYVQGTAAG